MLYYFVLSLLQADSNKGSPRPTWMKDSKLITDIIKDSIPKKEEIT